MSFLKGKTAIITGAGRPEPLKDGSAGSIGYGIAIAYAKEGANLVITGRNLKKLEDAKEELERLYGIRVLVILLAWFRFHLIPPRAEITERDITTVRIRSRDSASII